MWMVFGDGAMGTDTRYGYAYAHGLWLNEERCRVVVAQGLVEYHGVRASKVAWSRDSRLTCTQILRFCLGPSLKSLGAPALLVESKLESNSSYAR